MTSERNPANALMATVPVATDGHSVEGPSRQVKLRVADVSKSYRLHKLQGGSDETLAVLRHVSFDVYENEIVSLIGESGCGKTTLLRIIHGLIRLDRGEVFVNERSVRGPGRDRGMVFQQASLLPWRSAQRNVEFGLELHDQDKTAHAETARHFLQLVGLADFANHYPHQLSGGMQQRVGLARALAIDPEVLLMDEPFSALDAQTREVQQRELLRVQEVTNKTTLFVTHDLDEALYLSDRIVVLAAKPGRVKEVISVPFGRPRLDLPLLRGDPQFQELRAHIWSLISSSHSTDA